MVRRRVVKYEREWGRHGREEWAKGLEAEGSRRIGRWDSDAERDVNRDQVRRSRVKSCEINVDGRRH